MLSSEPSRFALAMEPGPHEIAMDRRGPSCYPTNPTPLNEFSVMPLTDLLFPALQGFGMGGGLIIAIGAQNAFVLKSGLKRHHLLPVVLFCFLSDALLIAAGVGGFGTLVAAFPVLTDAAAIGGALFLAFYGARAAWSALRPGSLNADDGATGGPGLFATLATIAALTWLNPHVYLDTVVLLGGIAGQFPMPARIWFGIGAATASAAWFFTLGYGARLLAPLFAKPAAWRVLDGLIALVMWAIAASLILALVSG